MNGFGYIKSMSEQEVLNLSRRHAFLNVIKRLEQKTESSKRYDDSDDSDSVEVLKLKLKIAELKLKETQAKLKQKKVRVEYIQPEPKPVLKAIPNDWIDWDALKRQDEDSDVESDFE